MSPSCEAVSSSGEPRVQRRGRRIDRGFATIRSALLATPVPFLVLASSVGCDDEEGFVYHGESHATEVLMSGWTPYVEASFDDGAAQWLLLDTGAPFTELDPAVFGLDDGVSTVRGQLEAFGLTFPDLRVRVTDFGGRLAGLLGADVVTNFQLMVDYQDSRAFLFTGVELPIDVGADVEPGESVSASLLGARRVIVDAEIEGAPASVLIDTGSSYVAVDAALLDELGWADRPSLCCQSIITYQGVVSVPLTRLKSVSLSGAAEVTSVLAIPEHESLGLLSAISDETGRDVRALVGGAYFREFLMTVDYLDEKLWLERYRSDDHIDRSAFIGPGFEVDEYRGEFVVVHVWEDSQAWDEGVRQPTCDENGCTCCFLDGIDETGLAGMSLSAVQDLLHEGPPGKVRTFRFGLPGESLTVDLTTADLLPEYR